jgi:hypothetical protein
MQVVKHDSEVAAVRDPVIRGYLARRIAAMAPDWAPDSWDAYGEFLVLEAGDDRAALEAADCHRLLGGIVFSPASSDDDEGVLWDWAEDHGSFYEVGMVTRDDGGFQIALIPKAPGINPALLALCAQESAREAALLAALPEPLTPTRVD